MTDLYTMFKDWLGYEWPQVVFDDYQEEVLKAILMKQVPQNSKELAQRLKNLLPKIRK